MGDNLPPGTTPSDVDDAFGPPDTVQVHGTVHVAVSTSVPEHYSEDEIEQALFEELDANGYEQVLHAEVEEVDD